MGRGVVWHGESRLSAALHSAPWSDPLVRTIGRLSHLVLVLRVLAWFVEPMRLLPTRVEPHGTLRLQGLVESTDALSWPPSKSFFLRVAD
jgi:hypothetical protein